MVNLNYEELEQHGNEHVVSGYDTPLRADAFSLSETEKIKLIEGYFGNIMHTLGLDLTDDSLQGTPYRVAKMYVKEIFCGLDPKNKPAMSTFDNKMGFDKMLIEKDITLHSACEHRFVPILGKVRVAYFPKAKLIGISKINRLVQYYAQRPQVQERLVLQISNELKDALQTEDVAVYAEAQHLCVVTRGVKDIQSNTVTHVYSGRFEQHAIRAEFLSALK